MEAVFSQAGLDKLLAQTLMPPATPVDLQARVTAAVAREGMRDIEQSRMQLRKEHGDLVYKLRRRLVLQCVEAVALAACVFPPARLGVRSLSLLLGGLIAEPSPILVGLLSLALAVGAAISVLMLLGGARRPVQFLGLCYPPP